MKKTKLLGIFMFLSVILNAQSNALSFDGINDYVDAGSASALNASNIKTLECWVKFNTLSGSQEILSNSVISNGIELLIFGNGLSFYVMNGSNTSYINYPTSNLTTGVWYHIAATWDGTRESMRLYVNGISQGVRTDVGNINTSGVANPAGSTFKIGQWSANENRFYNGIIDEVRVWNVYKTQAEIKQSMYSVTTNATGLLAYYNLNEGNGTTAVNSSNSTVAAPNSNGILLNGTTWVTSPVQMNENALSFDGNTTAGAGDYVAIPANANYDFTTGTIECWVRPDNLTGNAGIISNRSFNTTSSTGASRFSFHMSTSTIGMFNGTEYRSLPFTSTPGTWYHLAFVCTPTATTAYVNGSAIGNFTTSTGTPLVINNSVTGQPMQIGAADNNLFEPFGGAIDEVRIWNTARTQSQIVNNLNYSLTGGETGLIGLYNFNQGMSGGNNTGLTTVFDKSSVSNNGTLINFSLSGASSNYITHSLTAATLPVELLAFNASKKANSIEISWSTASETNSAYFEVEKSIDGHSFTKFSSLNAAGNSTSKQNYVTEDKRPVDGVNFYRLKQVDIDGQAKWYRVVSVQWKKAAKAVVTLAPQPMHSSMMVKVEGELPAKAKFVMYSINGKEIKSYALNEGTNNTIIQVERGNLSTGIYFYKLISEKGSLIDSGKIVVE